MSATSGRRRLTRTAVKRLACGSSVILQQALRDTRQGLAMHSRRQPLHHCGHRHGHVRQHRLTAVVADLILTAAQSSVAARRARGTDRTNTASAVRATRTTRLCTTAIRHCKYRLQGYQRPLYRSLRHADPSAVYADSRSASLRGRAAQQRRSLIRTRRNPAARCPLPPGHTAPFAKHRAARGCDALPPPTHAVVGAAMRNREHRWHRGTTATRNRSSDCHAARRSPVQTSSTALSASRQSRDGPPLRSSSARLPGSNSLFKQRIVKDQTGHADTPYYCKPQVRCH